MDGVLCAYFRYWSISETLVGCDYLVNPPFTLGLTEESIVKMKSCKWIFILE